MRFLVEAQGKKLNLTADQLIEHLSGRIFSKEKDDIPVLALGIIDKMRSQMERIAMRDLVALSMQYGYYYRVFLEKNKVEVLIDESVPSETTGKPSN